MIDLNGETGAGLHTSLFQLFVYVAPEILLHSLHDHLFAFTLAFQLNFLEVTHILRKNPAFDFVILRCTIGCERFVHEARPFVISTRLYEHGRWYLLLYSSLCDLPLQDSLVFVKIDSLSQCNIDVILLGNDLCDLVYLFVFSDEAQRSSVLPCEIIWFRFSLRPPGQHFCHLHDFFVLPDEVKRPSIRSERRSGVPHPHHRPLKLQSALISSGECQRAPDEHRMLLPSEQLVRRPPQRVC